MIDAGLLLTLAPGQTIHRLLAGGVQPASFLLPTLLEVILTMRPGELFPLKCSDLQIEHSHYCLGINCQESLPSWG